MQIVSRTLFPIILLACLVGPLLAQVDTIGKNEEEVYISFRYQGVVDAIIVVYYSNDQFYFPITEMFDLLSINYDLSPSTLSISGFYLTKDARYVLDFNQRSASLKDQVFSLTANEFMVKEIDYFVTPNVFKKIFGLDLSVDFSRLTLRLETQNELPIVRRYNQRYKEELRQRYGNKSDQADYDLLADRNPRALDGALLDYSAFGSFSKLRKSILTSINIGGEVLYGDVQGRLGNIINEDTITFSSSDFRWRYVNPSQPWFSSVAVGQQSLNLIGNQTFHGVKVSNEPIVPQRSFDTYTIDGTTDPEVEIELYQDNRLVEVIKSDDIGYYRFFVPLNYGSSDFLIRIYEKQGRISEIVRRVQIPFSAP